MPKTSPGTYRGICASVARGLHLDGTDLVLARKQEIDFVRTTRLGFFERVIKELVPGTSEQLGDGIFVDIPQIGAELIGKQLPIDLVLRIVAVHLLSAVLSVRRFLVSSGASGHISCV